MTTQDALRILQSALKYLEPFGVGRNLEYNCARNILIARMEQIGSEA